MATCNECDNDTDRLITYIGPNDTGQPIPLGFVCSDACKAQLLARAERWPRTYLKTPTPAGAPRA